MSFQLRIFFLNFSREGAKLISSSMVFHSRLPLKDRCARFGNVERTKGFPNFVYRELTRGDRDGGCRVKRRLGLLFIKNWKQRLMGKD